MDVAHDYEHFIQSYVVLMIVPIIWGTYSPLVKYMYTSVKHPPPPFLFNTLSFMVSYISIIGFAKFLGISNNRCALVHNIHSSQKKSYSVIAGGIELGTWLFMGALFYISGIHSDIPASRAAILVQQTTIIVPILEALGKKRWPSSSAILSCLFAFIGTLFIIVGNPFDLLKSDKGSSDNASSVVGNLLVLSAALFYSIHIVRLGLISSRCGVGAAIPLATVKSGTQVVLSIALLVVALVVSSSQREASANFSGAFQSALSQLFLKYHSDDTISDAHQHSIRSSHNGPKSFEHQSNIADMLYVVGCLLWNGVFSIGFSMWAQTFAQRKVHPTQATVVYSMQPMWAGLFSAFFLGESLSLMNGIGVLFMIGSVATLVWLP